MPATALPWTWRERPERDRLLVFASRFDTRGLARGGLRSGIRLLRHSMRVRKQVLATPGAIGVALYAQPLRGRYYTYSAWRDEASLRDFARSASHREAVRAMRATGPVDGVLISWEEDAQGWTPDWAATLRRTDASPRGPYAGPAGDATPSAA